MGKTEKVPNEKTLKRLTEAFWVKHKTVAQVYGRSSTEIDGVWEACYIRGPFEHEGKTYAPLLEMEIAYAREQGHVLINEPQKPLTLVILVGLTFEPLLQSIAVHRPQTLIPILNHTYGDDPEDENEHIKWDKHWQSLAEYISMLKLKLQVEEPQEPVGDSAEEVFTYLTNSSTLRSALTKPTMRVIIDITGAKKTMVAGAFLLGMQSKAEIWYIDTSKYKDGRPYGYSCHFKQVSEPLRILGIDIWEQIQSAYGKGQYALAKALLPKSTYEAFGTFLHVLDGWDNGDLHMAKNRLDALDLETAQLAPTAITLLFNYWPIIPSPRAELHNQFFDDPERVLVYAYDEYERIKRLQAINALRSSFTRAFALHETLLKARVVTLYQKGQLYNYASSSDRLDYLLHKLGVDDAYAIQKGDQRQNLKRIDPYNPQAFLTDPTKYGYEETRNTRNRAVHTYFPMTQALVMEAIELLKDNLTNYKAHWIQPYTSGKSAKELCARKRFDAPDWEEVREHFGLLMPPQNIQQGEEYE